MKSHLLKFWSYYLVAMSLVAPYAPFINGAISQALGPHAKLVAFLAAVSNWIAHRLPPPSSVA